MATPPLEPLDPASLPPRIDVSDNSVALAAVQAVIDAGPYAATWESLRAYEPPLWYRDAKFGIFLHWGIPSVPAQGEWYSRTMYLEADGAFAHHRETYGPHERFGYKDFIPSFTMERFDPAAWAELFRRAGAQFVVPVAEHHDGFAMYDTARSRWNAVTMGPRRDVFGDLLTAVDDAWMVRGASSHRAEHWFFMNGGMRFDSDVRDPRFSDFYGPAQREETAPNELFLEDWLLRTVEIIDRYRPQVLWFDWWLEQPAFEPYTRMLAAYYYNRAHEWGRGVVINYKWTAFAEGTAVYDIERGAMPGIRNDVWQNDTTVGKTSWGWIDDHDYKSLDDLIGELVDVVAKNGNLLLNVGPKADGTIAEPEAALLTGIGDWLTVNGEAIFASRPWLIPGEGPTEVVAGSMIDDAFAPHTSEDVRFTTRTDVTGDYAYAIALRWPDDGVARIRSWGRTSGLLTRRIAELTVLGAGPVAWSQDADALRVTLPATPPSAVGAVVKIWLEPAHEPPRKDFLHG